MMVLMIFDVMLLVWSVLLLKWVVSVRLFVIIEMVLVVDSVLDGLFSLTRLFLVMLLCSSWNIVMIWWILLIAVGNGGSVNDVFSLVTRWVMIDIFLLMVVGNGSIMVLNWWCSAVDSLLMPWSRSLVVVITLKLCMVCILVDSFGIGVLDEVLGY